MGIRVKYGGEAGMQWEGKGSKRNNVGLELGKEGVGKGRGRRLKWKGRVKRRNYSIIIIVIIRRGREGINEGRELKWKRKGSNNGKGRKV